jgi:hypothetical protein
MQDVVTLVLVFVPVASFDVAVRTHAWLRDCERRGSLRRRYRDLTKRREASEGQIVDLSGVAAARRIAVAVVSVFRWVGIAMIAAAVLLHPTPAVAILMLFGAIWIGKRATWFGNLAYLALTGDASIAFADGAWRYAFPGYRRGQATVLRRRVVGTFVASAGAGLLLASALPIIYASDTLPSPIPGIYVQHSGLPGWLLTGIIFAAGALGSVLAAWLERRVRRREMQEESGLLPRTDGDDPPIVFLRPFGSEMLDVASHPSGRRDGLATLLARPAEYFDDVVTWLMWSEAEVVAIADPASRLRPTVGAAHHLISDDQDWHRVVEDLLDRALAIVVAPGATPGVRWEVERVRAAPERVAKAFLLNARGRATAAQFMDEAGVSDTTKRRVEREALIPIAATFGGSEPTLLCSSLIEDLDIDSCVEWFLRRHTPLGKRLAAALAS